MESERLEPTFYSPAYNAALDAVEQLPHTPIGVACDLWSFGAYALCSELVWVAKGAGFPYVKMECFDPPFIDWDGVAWVDKRSHELVHKSHARDGDVLVSVSGTIGKVGVVRFAPTPIVSTNQHTIKIRPKAATQLDPEYISAFLMTGPAQTFLEREAGGAVQKEIYLHNFKRIPLVLPDKDAQHYIGSKVRQAQALREWARAAEASFRGAVRLDVPDATGRGRHSRVASSDLDADLNAGRFTPDRLEVRRALQRVGARRVEDFAIIATDNDANPSPRSRYLGLDGISSNSIDLALQRFDQAGVSGTCRVLPRGAAISKLRPYLNKAAFVPGGVGHVVGSTELLCVRSDDVHPAFVYGVLKLDTTLRQLNPVASGATHPRVGPEEVLDLLVPWHDDHERLGETLERAQRAYFGARALVGAARLLVEALIERKVTEAELIAAGKDPTADRALLSRLRDDGLDGEGEPLFTDLDALDALLAKAAS